MSSLPSLARERESLRRPANKRVEEPWGSERGQQGRQRGRKRAIRTNVGSDCSNHSRKRVSPQGLICT